MGERLFADIEGALQQRLGLGVAALQAIQITKVIEHPGNVGVIGTERLLIDGKGARQLRLGLTVPTLGTVEHAKAVERLSDVGVVGTESLLAERQDPLLEGGRLRVFAVAAKLGDLGDERSGIAALVGVAALSIIEQG